MNQSNLKKAAVHTLGCKVNQVESAQISFALERLGYHVIHGFPPGQVDLAVVNTCTVTHKAEAESRRAVLRMNKLSSRAETVAVGCSAQIAGYELASIKGVDYVFGNENKAQIIDVAQTLKKNEVPEIRIADMACQDTFCDLGEGSLTYKTRSFFKIQDGCDSFCSYCIVPYARGPSRSLQLDRAVDRIENLSHRGYQEVVLTGVHLGRYGMDLKPACTLLDLLVSLDSRLTETRIRLSSLEPTEITEPLLEFMKNSKRVCPHVHLPLQSGDEKVLDRMNRHYDSRYYRQIAEGLSSIIPHFAIGADVMVGFPGEDDAAFSHTYDLISSLPLSHLHVFPYSPRPGTPAAEFSEQVPEGDKKKRAAALRKLGAGKKRSYFNSLAGQYAEIIVQEGPDPKTGLMQGISERYVPVVFNGEKDLLNRLVRLRLTGVEESGRGPVMRGELESL